MSGATFVTRHLPLRSRSCTELLHSLSSFSCLTKASDRLDARDGPHPGVQRATFNSRILNVLKWKCLERRCEHVAFSTAPASQNAKLLEWAHTVKMHARQKTQVCCRVEVDIGTKGVWLAKRVWRQVCRSAPISYKHVSWYVAVSEAFHMSKKTCHRAMPLTSSMR